MFEVENKQLLFTRFDFTLMHLQCKSMDKAFLVGLPEQIITKDITLQICLVSNIVTLFFHSKHIFAPVS